MDNLGSASFDFIIVKPSTSWFLMYLNVLSPQWLDLIFNGKYHQTCFFKNDEKCTLLACEYLIRYI